MIFGVEEQKGTSDDKFIEQLLNDVKVSAKVKFVTRIGNKSNHKRPIKVVLESAHQRWLIMHSLTNLKGNTSYNGISVTEDFTIFERSMIQEWLKKAKESQTSQFYNHIFKHYYVSRP